MFIPIVTLDIEVCKFLITFANYLAIVNRHSLLEISMWEIHKWLPNYELINSTFTALP